MRQSKIPVWRKSMLQKLNKYEIREMLWEIGESEYEGNYQMDEGSYYHEYRELFEDLSDGASELLYALEETGINEFWDDMTVGLLGETHRILGYDHIEEDYYGMLCFEEDWAESEAVKRIERLTKKEMLRNFKKVVTTLILFYDVKAAHDCLTSIVEELDERAAMMKEGKGVMPQRAWVE